jgi:N-acetylneuraminic acid mutarotase
MKKYLNAFFLLTNLVSKGNYWTQKADFGGGSRLNAVSFSINGFGFVGTGTDTVAGLYIHNKDFWKYDPVTDAWTQIADVGNIGLSGTIGFSIGNYGYIGLGNSNFFWRYNPAIKFIFMK